MGDSPRSNAVIVPPSKGVTKFSTSPKGVANQMSVADVFTAFFYEDFRLGFEMEKNSESWKEDMDAVEKKRLKNKFASVKRAARFVLMHADSCPIPPEDPSQCKEILRRTAHEAEERIRSKLDFGEKRISFCTLTSAPEMKTIERTLSLPANTPEDARKFFSQFFNLLSLCFRHEQQLSPLSPCHHLLQLTQQSWPQTEQTVLKRCFL